MAPAQPEGPPPPRKSVSCVVPGWPVKWRNYVYGYFAAKFVVTCSKAIGGDISVLFLQL